MKNVFISIFFLSTFFSCNKAEEKPSIKSGKIIMAVDDAIKPILDAQINTYKIHYKGAQIETISLPENKGIFNLFKDSVTMVAATRDFNADELAVLKKREVRHIPTRMAVDAVALVVSNASTVSKLSFKEAQDLFKTKKYKLVFDSGNSANLNLIKEILKLNEIPTDNVFAADGNLDVLEKVKNNTNTIGFIGYNWISDKDDPKVINRLKGIKLVAVEKPGTGVYFEPNFKNLKDRNYVFERFIYLHTFKKDWGIENGFQRHACTKIGQLVTEKMGLVPFYIIPREMLINKKAVDYKSVKE